MCAAATSTLQATWTPVDAGIFRDPSGAMACGPPLPGSHFMKWETPQAVDMRFGFEITMYISNR